MSSAGAPSTPFATFDAAAARLDVFRVLDAEAVGLYRYVGAPLESFPSAGAVSLSFYLESGRVLEITEDAAEEEEESAVLRQPREDSLFVPVLLFVVRSLEQTNRLPAILALPPR